MFVFKSGNIYHPYYYIKSFFIYLSLLFVFRNPWTFFFHVHRGYIMVINGMKSGFLFEIDVFPTFSVQNIL